MRFPGEAIYNKTRNLKGNHAETPPLFEKMFRARFASTITSKLAPINAANQITTFATSSNLALAEFLSMEG